MHNDGKFNYSGKKAVWKYIIADRVRYIRKELNYSDEAVITGIDDALLEFINHKLTN